MKKMLINATQQDELRVAITDNGLLIDLDIEHAEQQQKQSNIYKGIITSIEPHLDAVFINYGSEKHGFLPLKEISEEYFITQPEGDIQKSDIKKLLREGQEVVVQVEKDERGTKGAALTTFISLAGSYLVLMPNRVKSGGVSRRIEGEDREQLKQIMAELAIPEGMSAIARTAGVGRSAKELQWDLEVLLRYWEAVKQAAVAKKGPYLIHKESDVIIRAIRDYLRHDIEEVIIDEPSAYDRAQAYIQQIRPDFLPNLKLYSDHFPLYSRYQVEQQIENAYEHEVQLPSGGSIVIDHTEALVAIDINSARATKGGNIEETAFHTNKEAAEEIARQMRIRDIGGLIVIDFIDMTSTSNQRQVENTLREAMSMDRARIQIGRISRFGLLELSRQRIRSALVKTTQNICKHCNGRGIIRSVESLSLAIIHMIQEHAAKTSSGQLQVQLPVDVATYIMNEKRDSLESIKKHSQLDVLLIPNPHIQTPHYDFKILTNPKNNQAASYHLVQIPKPDATTKRSTKPQESKEPAINQFLSTPGNNNYGYSKRPEEGVIKRLWGMMFGSEEEKQPVKAPSKPQNRKPQSNKTATQKSNDGSRRGNRGGAARKTSGSKNTAQTARNKPQNKTSKPNPRKPQSHQRQNDKPRPAEKTKSSSPAQTENKATQRKKPVPKTKPNNQGTAPEQPKADEKNNPNTQLVKTSDLTQKPTEAKTALPANTKPSEQITKTQSSDKVIQLPQQNEKAVDSSPEKPVTETVKQSSPMDKQSSLQNEKAPDSSPKKPATETVKKPSPLDKPSSLQQVKTKSATASDKDASK